VGPGGAAPWITFTILENELGNGCKVYLDFFRKV
jgi:hypothetical protein